jgi:hypothetical protein
VNLSPPKTLAGNTHITNGHNGKYFYFGTLIAVGDVGLSVASVDLQNIRYTFSGVHMPNRLFFACSTLVAMKIKRTLEPDGYPQFEIWI